MHPVIVRALAAERAKDLRAMGAGRPRNARSGHPAWRWRWRSAQKRRPTAHGRVTGTGTTTTAVYRRARTSRSGS